MQDGRILDQGPHTVLMDRNEQYLTLIRAFLSDSSQGSDKSNGDADVEMLGAKLVF